jgi:acetolactate synthase-1/2/3 large subunit
VAEPSAVAAAADLIAGARSPLLIAGGGLHGSQAHAELEKLQSLAALPVAYTMMGKGAVDDAHPLTAGLLGNAMGARSLGTHLRPLVAASDVILLVGSRTNQNGTDNWTLFPSDATLIHIDIDGMEVGRTYEAVRLVGDIRETLRALIEQLQRRDLKARHEHANSIREQIRTARAARDQASVDVRTADTRPLRPERVMKDLSELLTPNTTVVADASYSSVWISSYLDARAAGMRFLSPRGLAGLGWGFPMAIGAKAARPADPVVCLAGDGGFGHVWSELETVARENLAVTLLILNNQVLGFQKDAERVKFGRHTGACHFSPVDHTAVARACGLEAHRVEDVRELRGRLAEALGSPRTVVLEIMTHPDAYPPLTMFDGALPY